MSPRTFVTRGVALVALTALGFTACSEDKIVQQPPPSNPITVNVTPDALPLQVGQTGTLIAVISPSDSSQAVTWASSNTSVATVDGSGTVTAVAVGTATITATSTANANAKDAAVVTVTAAGGGTNDTVPPTLTIAAILDAAGGPVNPTDVEGPITIQTNIQSVPGTPISAVNVLLDSTVVCTQSFGTGSATSGAQKAEGTDDVLTATCPIDTEAYDTLTGAAKYFNGSHQLTAQIIKTGGTVFAQVSQTLLFQNEDRVFLKYVPTEGPAIGPNGLAWVGGDITINALPVIYSAGGNTGANAVQRVTVSLQTVGGGADQSSANNNKSTLPGAGVVTAVDSSAADGFNVTFSGSKTIAAGGIQNVEDVTAVTVNTVTTAGQVGASRFEFRNPQDPNNPNQLRVDNVAPRVRFFAVTTATNGYINGDFSFGSQDGCTSTDVAAPAGTAPCFVTEDDGVDRQSEGTNTTFMAGPASSLAPATTGADLAESETNQSYIVGTTVKDALGNSRTVYASTTFNAPVTSTTATGIAKFGVDLTPPTVAFCSSASACPTPGVAADKAFSTPTQFFTLILMDTARTNSGAGPAGFSATPVQYTIQRFDPADPDGACVFGDTSGGGCDPASGGSETYGATAGGATTFSVPVSDGEVAKDAYYVLTATVFDQAGNPSTTVTRTAELDQTAPETAVLAQASPITGGQAAVFNLFATDNIDLGKATPFIGYGLGGTFEYPSVQLGTFGYDVFTTQVNTQVSIPAFIRSIEQTTANAPNGTIYGAQSAAVLVSNLPGTTLASSSSDISSAVTLGTSFSADAVPVDSFTAKAAKNTLCFDKNDDGCSTNPTTTTLTAQVFGPFQVFANPFVAVNFYVLNNTTGRYEFIGAASAVQATDNTVTNTRTWTYTGVSYTAKDYTNAAWTTTQTVIAVGVDSTGRALMAAPISLTVGDE